MSHFAGVYDETVPKTERIRQGGQKGPGGTMPKKGISLADARQQYMRWDRMRQKSEATKLNHWRTLEALQEVVGRNFTVANLTGDHFNATIARLAKPAPADEAAMRMLKGKHARTGRDEVSLNIDRGVLRTFAKFLHDAGHLSRSVDPASGLCNVQRERTASPKRESIHADKVMALLELAGNQHPRDRIACALAIFGGLRESEIRNMKVSQVKLDEDCLDFYRPKLRDHHRVGISPALRRELNMWFAWYREHNGELQPHWFVVPPKRQASAYRAEIQRANPGEKRFPRMGPGWPVNPEGYGPKHKPSWDLRSTIKPLLAQIGVTDLEGKGMHTLRRTLANMMREAGHDIRIIQNTLGHKSQATTEIYMDINVENEKARRAVSNWDPFPQANPDVIDLASRRRNAG